MFAVSNNAANNILKHPSTFKNWPPEGHIKSADSSGFGSNCLKCFLIESTFINQENLDENPGFWLLLKNLKINNHWV